MGDIAPVHPIGRFAGGLVLMPSRRRQAPQPCVDRLPPKTRGFAACGVSTIRGAAEWSRTGRLRRSQKGGRSIAHAG